MSYFVLQSRETAYSEMSI